MAKRYIWPTCTYPGCACVRTWRSEKSAHGAAHRHWSEWVQANGHAFCSCHGIAATFPCDKSLEKTASA